MTRSPAAALAAPLLALLLLVVALFGVVGAPGAAAHADPGAPPPRVVFVGAEREVPIVVELARSEAAERVGLMLRLYVPPYAGMLFVMPTQQVQAFWMKNTVTSLDMVFVDDAHKVVGIVHRAAPLSEDLRFVHQPSRFVIELAGGFARTAGIAVGDSVRFEGVGDL